jgi:hypothetical protein
MASRDVPHPPVERDRAGVSRKEDEDLVVESPPVTDRDVRRVQELDRKYGWERFREKR